MSKRRVAAAAIAAAATALVCGLQLLQADITYAVSPAARSHLPPTFLKRHNHAVVLQQSLNDCGPAAVATLDSLRGIRDTLTGLDNELDTSRSGTTIGSMRRYLTRHLNRPIRAIPETIQDLRGRSPVIVWRQGHYLVVYSVTARNVELLDPWFGDMATANPAVKKWTTIAFI